MTWQQAPALHRHFAAARRNIVFVGRDQATNGVAARGVPVYAVSTIASSAVLLTTADHAAGYLQKRARLLALLAQIGTAIDEWQARGRPPPDLYRLAPSLSLETLWLLRMALVEAIDQLDA